MNITVVIPSIPPRAEMLKTAIGSCLAQTLPPASLAVALDTHRVGAGATRDRALHTVRSDWVTFLDDDDWMLPQHLERLSACAEETGADYVYSYFWLARGYGAMLTEDDPLSHFGEVFDPADPIQTTVVTLVRTELAQTVGYNSPPRSAEINGQRWGEDYEFTLKCVEAGACVVHLPERTWVWNHHGLNTSGQPGNW